MEIDKSLFLRRDVARLGLAPATSMYWFSETVKGTGVDWRPEVHDSDGLAIWNGAGEHLWRPLNNPPRTMSSAFSDQHLRGFGLLQRDRDFDHYLDGVHYERRPSLWVEPVGDWGEGEVQLIELRTDDEIHDNIVAMWVPKAPARAVRIACATGSTGSRTSPSLPRWHAAWPRAWDVAASRASQAAAGAQVHGGVQGEALAGLPFGVKPEAVITASRGSISYVYTEALPNGVPGHWRAQFDLTASGEEPVELRLFLRHQGQALSETWLFQYHPFAAREVY
jgi:glucans biosynthesis protein